MRSIVLVFVSLVFLGTLASAQSDSREGMGEPPRRLPDALRGDRSARILRSSTVGGSPRAISPPGYYDLSVAGDLDLGGAIFRNGYPFIHQDGGVYNTAVGTDALISLTTGYYNVAFGYRALRDNQTGRGNTAVGGVALLYNISGDGNTAIGDMTLRQNTTGIRNTAVGQYALVLSVDGNDNTAIGHSVMTYTTAGNGNTAIGAYALGSNTSGAGLQTAVGYRALFNNYNQENSGFGARALYSNVTGRNNVGIGSYSLYSSVSGDDNIALGRRAGFNLGGTSNSNIMIGSEGPSVVSVETQTIRIGAGQTRAFLAGVSGTTTDVADAVAVMVDSSGQLGTVSSSRRYKDEILDMGEASAPLRNLRPVTFRFKRPFADGGRPVQFGLIAEEVAASFPELVSYDPEGRPESVKYHLLSVLLLNELQSMERELLERDRLDAEQEGRMAALEAEVARLSSSTPAGSSR